MQTYFPQAQDCPSRRLFPGVEISTWWAENLMLSLATLVPGSVVELHQHPHEQLGLVLEGSAIFTIGGETRTLSAGDRFRIPGNVPHKVVVLDRPCRVLDAFSPVRAEYTASTEAKP